MGIIRAWVAYRYRTDIKDVKLLLITGPGSSLITFSHPRGRIYIDRKSLDANFTDTFKRAGYETKDYEAFADGFEGREKPSKYHPVLRHYYNKGLEARAKRASAA